MNREYGDGVYKTILVRKNKDGFKVLALHRTSWKKEPRDSQHPVPGCLSTIVDTFGSDVALEILEELISDAKEKIKVR